MEEAKRLSKGTGRVRQSNFELLRIVSMFLIVAHHYSVYGGFDFSAGFSGNKFLVQVLSLGGRLGVNCFVLISGYFLSTQTQYRWKSIFKFILQVLVFAVVINLAFVFAGQTEFNLKKLFPFIFEDYWWFVRSYFVLILIAPFLSRLVLNIKRKSHFKLIVLLSVLWSVIPTLTLEFAYMESSNLAWFVLLYLTAAYIRKYPNAFSDSRKFSAIILALSTFFIIITVFLCEVFGTRFETLAGYETYFAKMQMFPLFIQSISLFCLFKNIKPFSNKFINTAASGMFGVYLIHEQILIRPVLWDTIFRNADFQESNLLILHAFVAIVSVFLVCTIISLLYNFLVDKPVSVFLNKNGNKIAANYRRLKRKTKSKLMPCCLWIKNKLT